MRRLVLAALTLGALALAATSSGSAVAGSAPLPSAPSAPATYWSASMLSLPLSSAAAKAPVVSIEKLQCDSTGMQTPVDHHLP